MKSLHRISKRAASTASQSMIKQEISPTITRLDYVTSGDQSPKSNQFSSRKPFRGPIQAAILDWAGTVIDAHVLAPSTCFFEAFKRHGVPITMAQAREPMGLRKDIHIQKILEMPEVRESWIKIKGHEPNDDTIQELYEAFVPMQLDVLDQFTTLIPGTTDAVDTMKSKFNMKIGTTTGFTKDMVDILRPAAAKQGYVPDSNCAGDEVEYGMGFRPAPFMLYKNLLNLGVYPIESVIKVDDTTSGIDEGLNAGCWSIGVYGWGNYTDIDSMEQWDNMSESERIERRMKSKEKLVNSGAHYVCESIVDIPQVIEHINERLKYGEHPMNNYNGEGLLK
eukprot:CAMPEP_0201567274 /NCGR_PEP_ID=MMETSP0190_2-20130828/7708_1 /ASSEMBLY_ACC=CAM_ASM_000263 /TAXON_ID=37353 /ORGANISM="Rosalina sp." /LENGTH=335 /DNA_ID=CAMNT_0047987081 /DNA_START=58 /DNA_END=1065 /DNA_ORIENTATION=+